MASIKIECKGHLKYLVQLHQDILTWTVQHRVTAQSFSPWRSTYYVIKIYFIKLYSPDLKNFFMQRLFKNLCRQIYCTSLQCNDLLFTHLLLAQCYNILNVFTNKCMLHRVYFFSYDSGWPWKWMLKWCDAEWRNLLSYPRWARWFPLLPVYQSTWPHITEDA